MSEWISISAMKPPNGEEVETKVEDCDGERNQRSLKRRGNLWWHPDGSMYVYYTPTHWRPLQAGESE